MSDVLLYVLGALVAIWLLRALVKLHPVLEPHLEDGIAVAIDGEIFQDAWFAKVGADSEVHIMPRIAGG